MNFDVAALGRAAEQVECLVRAAALLRHQDALGLLDDRHSIQPGLQPGEGRVVQQLPPWAADIDGVNGRLQPRLGFFEPLRLRVELQPGGLPPM